MEFAKAFDALELVAVLHLAEAGMVEVLQASASIDAERLQSGPCAGCDPYVGPGRRDREMADALLRRLGDGHAVLVDVVEPVFLGAVAAPPVGAASAVEVHVEVFKRRRQGSRSSLFSRRDSSTLLRTPK
jgi:hypothetical protein